MTEIPDLEVGDAVRLNGEAYTYVVTGVDPDTREHTPNDVKSYTLDDGTDSAIRLEPGSRGNPTVLVEVSVVEDVEIHEAAEER